jgi:serine/threonine protein phosphatase 1
VNEQLVLVDAAAPVLRRILQAFLLSVEQGIPRVVDTALEGRGRIARNDQTGVPGVGRLFVGHTPQRGGPKRFGNVYAIDTGAIFNVLMGKDHYGLTMANVAAVSLPLVYVGEGKISQVIVVDNEVRDQPFGDCVKAGG